MVRPPIARTLALSILPFVLGACDETDAVAVRVRLREDLSGTVSTSGLVQPASDGPVQAETRGASWESRVDVACASGTFAALSDLRIVDIEFRAGQGGEGIGFARVVLPRGEAARWPKAFVPLSGDERKNAAAAIDPSGRSDAIGTTLKIEVELPSTVVGNGLTGKVRGTKTSSEGAVATLVVPLETMVTAGDPIEWHLTWQLP